MTMEEGEAYIADRVFLDLLHELRMYTFTYSELQFDTMRSRLLRKIELLH